MSFLDDSRRLRRGEPCPVCGSGAERSNSLCRVSPRTGEPEVVWCGKAPAATSLKPFKTSGKGALYRLRDRDPAVPVPTRVRAAARTRRRPNFGRLFASAWWPGADAARVESCAAALGVSAESLRRIDIGSADAVPGRDGTVIAGTTTPLSAPWAWLFPLRSFGSGEIAGASVRLPGGGKYLVRGSDGDGLFTAADVAAGGELLAPEGASDLAALLTLGFDAVGRINNAAGAANLAAYARRLRARRLVVIGDNDARDQERADPRTGEVTVRRVWPGLEGAEATAAAAAGCCPRVEVLLPPPAFKDVREWLRAGATAADVARWLQSDGRRVA